MNTNDFPDIIDDLKAAGISQRWLVESMRREGVSVSQATLSRIRNKVNVPSLAVALALWKYHKQYCGAEAA